MLPSIRNSRLDDGRSFCFCVLTWSYFLRFIHPNAEAAICNSTNRPHSRTAAGEDLLDARDLLLANKL